MHSRLDRFKRSSSAVGESGKGQSLLLIVANLRSQVALARLAAVTDASFPIASDLNQRWKARSLERVQSLLRIVANLRSQSALAQLAAVTDAKLSKRVYLNQRWKASGKVV